MPSSLSSDRHDGRHESRGAWGRAGQDVVRSGARELLAAVGADPGPKEDALRYPYLAVQGGPDAGVYLNWKPGTAPHIMGRSPAALLSPSEYAGYLRAGAGASEGRSGGSPPPMHTAASLQAPTGAALRVRDPDWRIVEPFPRPSSRPPPPPVEKLLPAAARPGELLDGRRPSISAPKMYDREWIWRPSGPGLGLGAGSAGCGRPSH